MTPSNKKSTKENKDELKTPLTYKENKSKHRFENIGELSPSSEETEIVIDKKKSSEDVTPAAFDSRPTSRPKRFT